MPSVPLHLDTTRIDYGGATPPTHIYGLIVSYHYIPDSALTVNGAGDADLVPVQYSYNGTADVYEHNGLSFPDGAFDNWDVPGHIPTLTATYPDSWLELVLSVYVFYYRIEQDGGYMVQRHWAVSGYNQYPLQPRYVQGFLGWNPADGYGVGDGNYYVLQSTDRSLNGYTFYSVAFRQTFLSGGGYTSNASWEAYFDTFLPFHFRYEFGDGNMSADYQSSDTSSANFPITGNGFFPAVFHQLPAPHVYNAENHINYPKVWITDARGQRMRPVYFDLYPTATLQINGQPVELAWYQNNSRTQEMRATQVIEVDDLDVQFDLNIWDFEDDFSGYDVGFGDGEVLLGQTSSTLSHTFALDEHEYTGGFTFNDSNVPNALFGPPAGLIFTVRTGGGHPTHSLTDPLGLLYAAIKSGSNIQVIREHGGGYNSRENVFLLTDHKNPSIYQAGGSRVFLGAQNSAGGFDLYYSDDSGATFNFMAQPFDGDTTYKKVRASGTAEGGGLAAALKDGVIWFTHSWDNVTWSTPINTGISSTKAADVHQQATADSSRLVIITSEGTYASDTADGTAGSWAPLT